MAGRAPCGHSCRAFPISARTGQGQSVKRTEKLRSVAAIGFAGTAPWTPAACAPYVRNVQHGSRSSFRRNEWNPCARRRPAGRRTGHPASRISGVLVFVASFDRSVGIPLARQVAKNQAPDSKHLPAVQPPADNCSQARSEARTRPPRVCRWLGSRARPPLNFHLSFVR